MSWSKHVNLKVHLAETGDVESAFAGGSIKFYNASSVLLASANIATAAGQADGTVDISFTQTTVVGGVSAQTATNAKLFKSNGTTELLSTNDVGDNAAAHDIQFTGTGSNTNWNTGDNVVVGVCTIDLTGL